MPHTKPNPFPDRPLARILLVDDEPDQLLTLKAVLSKLGYEVTTAVGYEEAYVVLRDGLFDLVICDLCLNRQKGQGLLLVGDAKKAARPPAVILVASDPRDVENSLDSVRASVDEYLFKPIGIERLLGCISRAFEKHPPRRHHLPAHARMSNLKAV